MSRAESAAASWWAMKKLEGDSARMSAGTEGGTEAGEDSGAEVLAEGRVALAGVACALRPGSCAQVP